MSSLSALHVAVEMATRQRDDARRALQDAQNARHAAADQLHQLQSYAVETDQRWGMAEDTLRGPEVLYHHRHFMGRLDHAIGLQTGVVHDQDTRLAQLAQRLLQAELRLTSLRKVVERRQHELALAQMRRDQKQTDERASLQYRSSPPGLAAQES